MFSQSDTIHFACHQCGKCCQKSPHMHFYDMIELSDEFIFQTSHHAVISYAQNPLETELLGHYQALGHTIMMPEIEASLFYFLDFLPIAYPSYGSCPKLIDNKCSIYGKRPTSCKIAPLDARFDDTQQWRTLNYFKKNVENHDWKCSFSESDPVVFHNEEIYQPGLNSFYFSSVDALRDFTDKYIEFLGMHSKNQQDYHFKALFKSVTSNNLMITDMIIPLQVARYHNIISEDVAINFIENQLSLIEKEMLVSTQLKRKENLQVSRLYKKQKDDYRKAIKENIFRGDPEHFDIYN